MGDLTTRVLALRLGSDVSYPVRLSTVVLENYEIIFVIYIANIAFHSVMGFLSLWWFVLFLLLFIRKFSNFGS